MADNNFALLMLFAAILATPILAQGQPEHGDLNRAQVATPGSTSPGAASQQADWKGVRPGQSTRAQVETLLGKPAAELTNEAGQLYYVYPPGEAIQFNRVYFDANGVVTLVGIGMFTEKDQVRFSELKQKYGTPKRLHDRASRDPHSAQSTFLFPREAGLWVVADDLTDEVSGATFYDPRTEPDIPAPPERAHK